MDEGRLPPITEIPFDKFIEEFVKGGEALTDEEYAGIGDFSDLCQTILGEDKRELDVYLQVVRGLWLLIWMSILTWNTVRSPG